VAGFAHLATETGPLAISLGGRIEDNERFGNIGSWQAGVAAHLPERPSTRLRLSMGSAIKEPTFAENYATGLAVGNPDLDPEWSLSWEAGVEHALFGDDLTASATFFQQRFREMIQYTFLVPFGEPNYFNVAAASARGLEVDATGRVDVVEAGLGWTWLDTEVVDAGFDSGVGATFVAGEPLIRRPRHTVALSLAAPIGSRARVHSRMTFVGSRSDRDFSTFPATPVELEGYTLWTLGGEWAVRPPAEGRPSVSVSVRAENLLAERYEEAFAFPAPRRQLYVGLSVGFGS
jgi:vitamin B12 transporter